MKNQHYITELQWGKKNHIKDNFICVEKLQGDQQKNELQYAEHVGRK